MIETIRNEINNETASLCLMNESLKKHTTYGIGGPADLMIFPNSKQDLIKVIEIINDNKIQLTILGSGSNVLISDNGIRGAVISLKNSLKQIEVDGNILYAECGTMLGKIVKHAVKNNLIGLENLNGVPGTLGGALIMNAGAWGGEISENLIHVEVINSKSEIQKIQRKDLNFSYRQSSFNKDDILLSAKFNLKKADKDIIKENFIEAQSGRKKSQPLNKRSAGSLFKNPKNNSAGKLLDKAGLKGLSIGDAKISEKHANFFINDGDASSRDMLMLIKKAHKAVKDKFNVNLSLEVKLMGFNEDEIGGLC
ncbi:MAG: UDP-N-acetylmuramate dehydrogenase [Candidatus Marinimicrobia bacterium]|nr:UDP-N-acetylmuramate dehydrogenase [Candidatus Neomarinimicrobiota bacterium]MDA0753571.1 UDP-N-acetylmuramate dehydrogenase [Candidatus Neomarinimicrobiota bacterium]MDA1363448.1 UDP-N-acetylmuramate dehydrogenase [Candidatus Neomarinimicrobiota bacterium]